MEFEEWLRKHVAPDTASKYIRYYYRYRDALDGLRLGELECNSWVLKLAGHWIGYLYYTGRIDIGEYSRLGLELRERRRLCMGARPRVQGADRCPDRAVMPDGRTRLYWAARALLESGVRLRHLVIASRMDEYEIIDDVVVVDLGIVRGYKRSYIAVLSAATWLRARRVLGSLGYDALRQRFSRGGYTGPSCLRKLHYNVCMGVVGDRSLCNFLQGREAPVDIAHYERYRDTSVNAFRLMRPALEEVARGSSLRLVLRRYYQPSPGRVKGYEHPAAGLDAEVPGELGGYGYPEADAAIRLIRDYSNFLG
ncbi:MAG: hypothetical protein GSR84_00255 [Desulfurococcales archaeon]|nr:hypothetical protein [Desulfurococcales archaeon]